MYGLNSEKHLSSPHFKLQISVKNGFPNHFHVQILFYIFYHCIIVVSETFGLRKILYIMVISCVLIHLYFPYIFNKCLLLVNLIFV